MRRKAVSTSLALLLVISLLIIGCGSPAEDDAAPPESASAEAVGPETYTVLNPQGVRAPIDRVIMNPRPSSLDGKTVYVVAQDRIPFTQELANRFQAYVPGATVEFRRKITWLGPLDLDLEAELKDNADAVIYGTAMGGGSGNSAVESTIYVESLGIPAVYVVTEPYAADVDASAEQYGMPAMRYVLVPLVEEADITTDITDAQYTEFCTEIFDALTVPLNEEESRTDPEVVPEPPPRIAMTGTFDEVQDYFYDQQWTDGLPIVPPTEERVREMLAGTSHSPDEVVAIQMAPEDLTVTVEKVAVVGAMAGCKPEYMPVLLAITEAWGGEGHDHGQTLRSDSSFQLMLTVNGPIRNEIGMNSDLGALGPGNQANATIGRFFNLSLYCLGGAIRGINDMGSLGNSNRYSFCFGENEEMLPEGWEPFHVQKGYDAGESVVSLFSGGWGSWGFLGDLDDIAKAVAAFSTSKGTTTILMDWGGAQIYAEQGMTKEDISQIVFDLACEQIEEVEINWFSFVLPAMITALPSPDQTAAESVGVIVVGGKAGLPNVQAWQFNPNPDMVSIDKWR